MARRTRTPSMSLTCSFAKAPDEANDNCDEYRKLEAPQAKSIVSEPDFVEKDDGDDEGQDTDPRVPGRWI